MGVAILMATTSSPRISPARGVTSVAPMSTPRSRSATSFSVPPWKSWMEPQAVAGDDGARFEVEDHVGGLLLDRHAGVADKDLHAVVLEVGKHQRAHLRLLQREETRAGFDDGDLRTQSGESLSQLHADRAPAEHDEAAG